MKKERDSETNNLKEEIIRIRDELNSKVESNDKILHSTEILELSQKLDEIIARYLKETGEGKI